MFGLRRQLQQTASQKKAYLETLRTLLRDPDHRAIFDHLYMNLDIIDNKAGALVQFNSIAVALYAALITVTLSLAGVFAQSLGPQLAEAMPALGWLTERHVLLAASLVGGALSLWSTLILFDTIYLHWSDAREMADVNVHSLALLEVRNRRTVEYRTAHRLCAGSYYVFAATFLLFVYFATA